MDHSVNSCGSKLASYYSSINNKNKGQNSCDPEEEDESGWTTYFEDFSRRSNNNLEPSGGSSLVSDAASNCAACKKFSHQYHHNNKNSNIIHHHHHHHHHAALHCPEKLCFKKGIRAKQISEDDPLEDTASSPVNSPKVGDLNSTESISSKIDGQLDGSMGKGSTSSEHNSGLLHTEEDEHELINFNGKISSKNIECTDLKKRGLCLVPLSMLVNYLG